MSIQMRTTSTFEPDTTRDFDSLDAAIDGLIDLAQAQDSQEEQDCDALHGPDCDGSDHVNAGAHVSSILSDGDGPQPGRPWTYQFQDWYENTGATVTITEVVSA